MVTSADFIPITLTIAGSDSGGGAGIQADLKTFSALQTYGASVITAVTAQNTRAVTAVHDIPVEVIEAQLAAVFDDLDVRAIKIGMLSSVPIIDAVARMLEGRSAPVVLDPVMVAKSGDKLLRDDAIVALRERLLPLATVLTPNIPEAAMLLGLSATTGGTDTVAQDLAKHGAQLLAFGPLAVLMKGGHGQGETCVDWLVCNDHHPHRFAAPRRATRNTHGTGCTLSAAIAAGLAHGKSVTEAVRDGHAYLQGAIAVADTLAVGSGHGPVHHFHALWR